CYGGGALTTYDLATGDQKDSFAVSAMKYAADPALSRDGRWFAASSMGQTPVIIDLKNRRAPAPSAEGHARQPYNASYAAGVTFGARRGRAAVLEVDDHRTRVYDD